MLVMLCLILYNVYRKKKYSCIDIYVYVCMRDNMER